MSEKRPWGRRGHKKPQEPVVRIVWHEPTPWQARELIAAMDRHIEAQQKAAGKTAA